MRITDKIIQDRVINGLKQSAQKLSKTHSRIATMKNLTRPSDDPIGSAKIMGNYKDLYKVQQTIRNSENSLSLLNYTDSIAENVGNIIFDAKNETTTMASDTVSEDARKTFAGEIGIMIDQMLKLANTEFAGKRIFSGQKVLEDPYVKDADGNIEYAGDQGEIKQRVELGDQTMTVNVPGTMLFGQGTVEGGIFKVLNDLKNALESNNTTEINGTLSNFDEELNRISMIRGEIGVKVTRTQSSMDELQTLELSLKNEISKVEDVDMAEEAGAFIADQEAYQAALQATATILKLPKLTDYLS
jgi:flagellar hook-associated protein 3 FlgL